MQNPNTVSFNAFSIQVNGYGTLTVNAFTLTRNGNKYNGNLTVSDGNLANSWVDYEMIHLSITDNNDADGDGIPDLSDLVSGVAPTITAQPQSQTAIQGGNVSFYVTVSGTEPFYYQWRKNGANISNARSNVFTINNVSANDAANYTVVVTNIAGSVTSAVATLTVIQPPVITTQPTNRTVAIGGATTFVVGVSGTGPFTYQWRKDGNNISGANQSSYTIGSVTLNDGGAFSVVVNNSAGAVTSSVAWLTVIAPPSIANQPQSLSVVQGDSAMLLVSATGGQPLHYQWYMNGQPITGASQSNLVFAPVSLTHAGTYHVVVSNQFGVAASSNAVLNVLNHGPLYRYLITTPSGVVYQGLPFPARVTAVDAWENPVLNFANTVNLSASGQGQANTNILRGLAHTATGPAGMTIGYSFTPNQNLNVSHFRHYSGTKVTLWSDSGMKLAEKNVTSTPGTWLETQLDTPVALTAGVSYRLSVYVPAGNYHYRNDLGSAFAAGTINAAYLRAGDGFPNSANSSMRWPMVDIRYQLLTTTSLPLNPSILSNFVQGVWQGYVTILQKGTEVVLRANDGAGHVGESSLFHVHYPAILASPFGHVNVAKIRTEGFRLNASLETNVNYRLEATTDLKNWAAVTNLISASGAIEFLDQQAVLLPKRFYRLVKE